MQYNFFLLLTSVEKDATCIWLRSLQSFFLVSKLSSELGWFFCSSLLFSWFLFSSLLFPFLFLPNTLMIQRNIFCWSPSKRIALRGRCVCPYTRYDPLVHISNTFLPVFLFWISQPGSLHFPLGWFVQPCERFSSVFLFYFFFSTFLYFFSWQGDLEFDDAGTRRTKERGQCYNSLGAVQMS